MKKRLPIVLLLIWLCAQSNYSQGYNNQQGYIVTNANDTIYGSIKDRNDLKTEVSFRQLGQRDFLTYSPDDITCFSIENKSIYKSCNVQLDSLGSEKIFMEVLVQGYMSLYYCRDGFYLIEKGLEQYFLSKKADQIKATAAEVVVTPCHNCVDQLIQINQAYKLNVQIKTMAEIVADAL